MRSKHKKPYFPLTTLSPQQMGHVAHYKTERWIQAIWLVVSRAILRMLVVQLWHTVSLIFWFLFRFRVTRCNSFLSNRQLETVLMDKTDGQALNVVNADSAEELLWFGDNVDDGYEILNCQKMQKPIGRTAVLRTLTRKTTWKRTLMRRS